MIVASIDIGSNTVLMLIAEVKEETGEFITIRDEQRLPRISKGLSKKGRIDQKSILQLVDVLKDYFSVIKAYDCDKILMSATSAFRIAINREEIKSTIEHQLKTELKILSGEEEAELAFIGTFEYDTGVEYRMVIDIGGGSTEIVYGKGKNILYSNSFYIGVVSLSEKYISNSEAQNYKLSLLEKSVKESIGLLPIFDPAPKKVIALAGTPVTLACIYKGMQRYDEIEIEGLPLSKESIIWLLKHLSKYSPDKLLEIYPELIKGRQDLILSGTSILLYLMKILDLDNIIVSTRGIRYGAIIKYLGDRN